MWRPFDWNPRKTLEDFYESAIAFGTFQRYLSDSRLALAADMLKNWDEMNVVVAKIAKEVRG